MASVTQLRNHAKKALMDGKYDKALVMFEEWHAADPKDLRVYAKLAEMREKNGDIKGAIRDYTKIAEAYANDGFVVQAIAISKIILRIDPTKTEIQAHLKDLSEERGDDWAIRTMAPQAGMANASAQMFSFERTPLLSMLSGEELEGFINSLTLKYFEENEPIYRRGDKGDTLFLLGMGAVRLETALPSGEKKVYAQMMEGDFFGEQAFMSRVNRVDSAIAESDASILMLDRETFDSWVKKYPNIQSVVESFYRQRVLARLLAITPLFEEVPEDVRNQLADKFHLCCFDAGDVVVHEGAAGDSVFLIRSGHVQVFMRDEKRDGQPIVLGEIHEGSFFGEVSLLTGRPRTASVLALCAVELMELNRADFDGIVERFPAVKKTVESFQKKRVKDTLRTLVEHEVQRKQGDA